MVGLVVCCNWVLSVLLLMVLVKEFEVRLVRVLLRFVWWGLVFFVGLFFVVCVVFWVFCFRVMFIVGMLLSLIRVGLLLVLVRLVGVLLVVGMVGGSKVVWVFLLSNGMVLLRLSNCSGLIGVLILFLLLVLVWLLVGKGLLFLVMVGCLVVFVGCVLMVFLLVFCGLFCEFLEGLLVCLVGFFVVFLVYMLEKLEVLLLLGLGVFCWFFGVVVLGFILGVGGNNILGVMVMGIFYLWRDCIVVCVRDGVRFGLILLGVFVKCLLGCCSRYVCFVCRFCLDYNLELYFFWGSILMFFVEKLFCL